MCASRREARYPLLRRRNDIIKVGKRGSESHYCSAGPTRAREELGRVAADGPRPTRVGSNVVAKLEMRQSSETMAADGIWDVRV